jgi:hypothetical protein
MSLICLTAAVVAMPVGTRSDRYLEPNDNDDSIPDHLDPFGVRRFRSVGDLQPTISVETFTTHTSAASRTTKGSPWTWFKKTCTERVIVTTATRKPAIKIPGILWDFGRLCTATAG